MVCLTFNCHTRDPIKVGYAIFQLKDEDIPVALDAALDAGYRMFDCAHLYANEADLGRHFGQWFATARIQRDQLFITSKVSCSAPTSKKTKPLLNI